jgi:hypothetical protein
LDAAPSTGVLAAYGWILESNFGLVQTVSGSGWDAGVVLVLLTTMTNVVKVSTRVMDPECKH